MLVESYRKDFCLPPNPKAQHLRCYAYLDSDITEVLPYLNSVLRGYQFYRDPPSLTLKLQGRLITLYSKMIAINIVKDEAEADSILEWLKQEINGTWKRRGEIKASLEGAPKPRILDILRLLPKTNCQECGQPTCMVFASQFSEGSKALDDCRLLDEKAKMKLEEYLSQFRFCGDRQTPTRPIGMVTYGHRLRFWRVEGATKSWDQSKGCRDRNILGSGRGLRCRGREHR